jgi:hypothetical protein
LLPTFVADEFGIEVVRDVSILDSVRIEVVWIEKAEETIVLEIVGTEVV